jgi:hypothetical protein
VSTRTGAGASPLPPIELANICGSSRYIIVSGLSVTPSDSSVGMASLGGGWRGWWDLAIAVWCRSGWHTRGKVRRDVGPSGGVTSLFKCRNGVVASIDMDIRSPFSACGARRGMRGTQWGRCKCSRPQNVAPMIAPMILCA